MRHESFIMSNEYESYLALHSCNTSLELCNVEILIVNDFLRFNRFRVQLFQSSCSGLSGQSLRNDQIGPETVRLALFLSNS